MCWAGAPACLAPVPRGAREARPRLFGLGLDRDLRPRELSLRRHDDQERARRQSLKVIRDEILDLAHGGLSADELEKGKQYLIGSYPLRFDTSAKIAGQLVQIQLDGHEPSWLIERNARIAAASMADARRVADRVFGDGELSW